MQQTPQDNPGQYRDKCRTHLRREQSLAPRAAHTHQCEGRPGPEYGCQNMQNQNTDEQTLHCDLPLRYTIGYTIRIAILAESSGITPRSYKSPSRDEAAERTRIKLIAAAAKLLSSGTAGDFSLDAVAKQAGVTRLTVYNQFGSRRALLEAVFDDRARRAGLHRIADAMGGPDPREGLRKLVVIFCDFWGYDEGALHSLHGAGNTDDRIPRQPHGTQ